MEEKIRDLKISTIKIGTQFRKDFGDLEELAESIRQGLLQPIGVTPKRELVFGYRRLFGLPGRSEIQDHSDPSRGCSVHPGGDAHREHDAEGFHRFREGRRLPGVKAEIGNRKGKRTDLQPRENFPEVEPGQRTDDFAAKRAGLGNRKTAEQAERAIDTGVPELVEAMDRGEVSISAATEVARLRPRDQKNFLEHPVTHEKMTARQVRKFERLRRIQKEQEKERKAIAELPKRSWTVTGDQAVVPCNLLVTDPPQGFLPEEKWDNPTEGIEAFTRAWCRRWSKCGANYIAIFWNQKTKWDVKRWFDESLEGYDFQQECSCHRQNYKKPERMNGPHKKFRSSWEPVFVYCRRGFDRGITQSNHSLGSDLTDNDHHSANYPTLAQNGDSFQQHKCQKPVSAFRWLIHGLTVPGETVVDPFCGSGTAGIAAVQLGRKFHGIESDKEYRRIAEGRQAAFGTRDRAEIKVKTLRRNSVTHGNCLDLISLLPNNAINLVLTSPVYAEQRKGHYPSVSPEDYPEFTLGWMMALWDKLADDGSVLIVIRPDLKNGVIQDYVLRTRLLLRESGWNECEKLIWYKKDAPPLGSLDRPRRTYEEILWFSKSSRPHVDLQACGQWVEDLSFRGSARFGFGGDGPVHGGQTSEERPGQTRIPDVIDVPVVKIEKGIPHPAMFPVELAERLIQTFCPPAGTVLDPFCGSGSTLLAARSVGRPFYGIDIEAKYVEIARQRLEKENNGEEAGVVPFEEPSNCQWRQLTR